MTPPYGRKRRTKEPLDEVKEDSEKVGLKLNNQKTNIMASGPVTSWQIDGNTMEVITGHGTTNWFQIGRGVLQGCKLSH